MKNSDKLLLVLVVLLTTVMTSADQYRSKVYLDPDKKLTKSVTLSLKELEKQFSGFTDAYNISSAGHHIANNYLQQGEYKKAADYFEKSLAAEGLSDVINQQISLQLAKVYLLLKDNQQALATLNRVKKLLINIPFELTILTAQAQLGMSDYLGVSETLEAVFQQREQMNQSQLKQLLALYYKSSHYELSIKVLHQLIQHHSDVVVYWLQLTSIYITQGQYKSALDQLALARQKKLFFRESDILLLADLYLINKAPEQGAMILQQALDKNELQDNAENQNKLFNYWLQARENNLAMLAAEKSLQHSPDTELTLSLASLQMENKLWEKMNNTLLKSCQEVLADKYVSKANLLLGISQFKMGDAETARRSFINATLIGGSGEKANQWLKFIKASPATLKEIRKITKPCVPENTKVYTGARKITTNEHLLDSRPEQNQEKLIVKTIGKQQLYTMKLTTSVDQLAEKIKTNIMSLAIALVKNGGTIDGPFQLIHNKQNTSSEKITMLLTTPFKGKVHSKGRYRLINTKEFKCVSVVFQGPREKLAEEWKNLVERTLKQGHKPTGISRTVLLKTNSDGGKASMELQLGIM